MQYTLWKFFGLQRSGNHAIINWMIGLDQENILFFNNVLPGGDVLDKISGISLPKGTKAYATRDEGKRIIQPEYLTWFINNGGCLLLSYENYHVEKFSSANLNSPIIERFGHPRTGENFLVLRNPFNMLPSAEKMIRRTMETKGKDEKWLVNTLNKRLSLWKNYAFLHLHPMSITRGNFFPILFDRWVSEKKYRDKIAEELGYINKDRFLDFVSDAGKGSSFTGKQLGQRDNVLNRWKDEDSLVSDVIMNNPEVIDYTALIFGENAVPEKFRGV